MKSWVGYLHTQCCVKYLPIFLECRYNRTEITASLLNLGMAVEPLLVRQNGSSLICCTRRHKVYLTGLLGLREIQIFLYIAQLWSTQEHVGHRLIIRLYYSLFAMNIQKWEMLALRCWEKKVATGDWESYFNITAKMSHKYNKKDSTKTLILCQQGILQN